MSLGHRIARLERAAGPVGCCRACAGKGPPPPVLVWRQDLGEPAPAAPTCPACGARPQGSLRIVVLGQESTHAA